MTVGEDDTALFTSPPSSEQLRSVLLMRDHQSERPLGQRASTMGVPDKNAPAYGAGGEASARAAQVGKERTDRDQLRGWPS